MNYQKMRGTKDWFGSELDEFNLLVSICKKVGEWYGYSEIISPIFEAQELFTKSIGDTSDIVKKEFYNFQDKGQRWVALRPEGTAGCIRALVENKLLNDNLPKKVFYVGPMFRYDRPQGGRYRQFHQFGIESVGIDNTYDEIETIVFGDQILKHLGIKKYRLEINNIGTFESRVKWIEALKQYFKKFEDQLTAISIERLESNPLRILDDKVDGVKPFVKDAPKLNSFLSKEDIAKFDMVKKTLDGLGIEYVVQQNLVRGLDYYTELVYEFVSTSDVLIGQSTIIGGGKYNQLVADTGGPDLKGIGFGMGLERILIALKAEDITLKKSEKNLVYIAPMIEGSHDLAINILTQLRASGHVSHVNYKTYKLSKHLSVANKMNAKFIVIIGEKEINSQKATIKNLDSGIEINVEFDKIIEALK